jgi:beta-lactamase regulating signal transducer with metallopeptidase domain
MIGFEDFARLAAGQAVNCLLIGVALAALVSLLLRLIPRASSASRFAVLYSSLLAIMAVLFWRGTTAAAHSLSATAAITVSAKWATYAVAAWASIALFGIARIAWGLGRLQRLRRSFVPLDQDIVEPTFLGTRPAKIYVSDQVRVPTAIGFFRPAVVLPEWALAELSVEELRAAILHEFAHVDRWDDWTNLLQKVIRALLFFHPAVWWIDGRLAIERELSCDDMVLVHSPNPRSYAACLVSLAEKSLLRRPLELAQAAVGKVKQTTLRVSRILNGHKRSVGRPWKPALAAFGALSVLSFVAVEHTPQLVGFHSTAAEPVAIAQTSQWHSPQATLASMRIAPATGKFRPRRSLRSVPAHHARENRPEPRTAAPATSIEARVTRPHNPAVVNASAKESQTPQFVYFVVQTREYDGAGNMKVTTTVWRVPVPAHVQADKGTLPHST